MHFNIFFVNIQAEISKRDLSHTFQKMSIKGHDKYPGDGVILPIKFLSDQPIIKNVLLTQGHMRSRNSKGYSS